MVRCADGVAVGYDLARTGEIAAERALRALAGPVPDLAFVFASGADPDEVGNALLRTGRATGAATVLGCSADDGVIGGRRGIQGTTSVSVWLAHLPGATVRAFHLEVMRTDTSLAVVGMPPRNDDDVAVILLADTWSFPVEGFVDQTSAAMPGLSVAGALAAGGSGAGSTRLLVDGVVVDRGAVGVVLGGDVGVGMTVSQGCRPVGAPMVVTAADDNVLLELAGAPALDRLEELLLALPAEDQALATRGLQIGVAVDEYAEDQELGDYLVRGIVGVDAERRAVAVGDVIDVGRTVRFHLRDAVAAEAELVTGLGGFLRRRELDRIEGALLFSCASRGGGLFGRPDHDVLTVRSALHANGVAGFFSSGEIGPVGGHNHVHGFAASVVAFGAPAESARGPAGAADGSTVT
ncbi:MAG: FIST C-terminal domain-containing protein [Actinomycetota bacterium]|nr:FIST C-terminal domain-containing protein [Actinomycetota bacterium]MDH5277928.1 FIST C-terminal domain-containing protein [Actinomycetota bacterium]